MKRFENTDLLQRMLDVVPAGISIIDAKGNMIFANDVFERIWGGVKLVGIEQYHVYKGWWRDTGELIKPHEWAAARAIKQGLTSYDEEIEIECFDGTRKVILNSAAPIHDDSGAIFGAVVVNSDISDRVAFEDHLRTLSEQDPLTQAYTRRKLFDLLKHEVHRADRYHHPLSSILLDLDHFKTINDSFGHSVGDEVLIAVSRTIRENIRDTDIFGRLGGEEFLLVLPESDTQEAISLADKIRHNLAELSIGPVSQITCSMGVCKHIDGERPNELVHRADKAMYQAKINGRNRIELDSYSL
ncbi:sensor domain-containing diguanylate cyclase [Novimethylophilus kurashikiensis]|nr:sensor domain-containing diguanylate cyclase [Novimethylophilus kurashikiensis]